MLRIAVVWLFTAAVFVLLGWLLPGLTVTSAGAALAAAALFGATAAALFGAAGAAPSGSLLALLFPWRRSCTTT